MESVTSAELCTATPNRKSVHVPGVGTACKAGTRADGGLNTAVTPLTEGCPASETIPVHGETGSFWDNCRD